MFYVTSTHSVDPWEPTSSALQLKNIIDLFGDHIFFCLRFIKTLEISNIVDVPVFGSTNIILYFNLIKFNISKINIVFIL